MNSQISISDIKKNDHLCEFDGYKRGWKYVALEDAHIEDGYWICKVEIVGKKDQITLSCLIVYDHYGPELYKGDTIPYLNVIYLNDLW
jgi:hypothetical protein